MKSKPKSLWISIALVLACSPPMPTTEPVVSASPSPASPVSEPPTDPSPPANDTPERPESEQARDAQRRPQAVMDFFGIGQGDRVVELLAGGGYYVALLSARVGATGSVWAHNTPFVLARFAEPKIAKRLQDPALTNVQRLDTELEAPQLPEGLDAVMIVLFYHDLYWQGVDRAAMNNAVFAALKPGGVFGVIDHSAQAGHGSDEVKTLHRVEESLVTQEILAAGFTLEASTDILRNPDDPRDYKVFDPPDGRDKTDRFVLKFVKPRR